MSSTTAKKHKQRAPRFALHPLAVSLLGVLALATVRADGIIADPNVAKGQQPTVLQSNNGLPVVNIQTPTRAGVSVNQYRQFNVGENGTILNNSRQNVQTQLGGWIQGNPWLARGEARVIVNQVNSADPSRLNGYVEIGGRRADLVIANPAGINVNGGGFINANQVTLGAGNAVIQDGRYTGIAQGVGSLNIAGGGLDASRNDYTDLIANAVNVNGGIWANRLSVQAGSSSADTAAHPNTFAIDTGALGGMYAGNIHLMVNGAEQNSIRNAGQIFARAGDVRIDAAGNVVNSGSIVAATGAENSAVRIQSQGLDNSGSIAANQLVLNPTRINNSGHLLSAGEAQLQANAINNSGRINGGRLVMDTPFLQNSGTLQQTGLQGLSLHTAQLNNSGKIGYPEPESAGSAHSAGSPDEQSGNASSTSPSPSTAQGGGSVASLSSTPIALAEGKINARRLDNTGNITANGGIDLSNTAQLSNQGQLHLKQLTATGETLNNAHGKISTQNADIAVRQFHNQQGQVAAEQIRVHSQRLDNTQGSLDARALQLSAHTLDNSNGAIRSDQNSQLALSGSLKNQQGQISSAGAVFIQGQSNASPTLNNDQGSILAGEQLSIQAQSLTGKGEIASGKDAEIAIRDDFTTENNLTAGRKLTLRSEGNLTNRHQLHGNEAVVIAARQIDNQADGVIQSGQSTQLSADNISNHGLINSNGLTHIGSLKTLANTGTGRIYGDHVALSAEDVVNREETVNGETKAGVIAARARLDIGAKSIQNVGSGFNRIENGQAVQGTSSLISSEGTLHIGGQLNEQQAVGTADSLTNISARIESAGHAHIGSKTLSNQNADFSVETYLAEQTPQIRDYARSGENTYYQAGKDGEFDNSRGKKNQTTAKFILKDGTAIEGKTWHVRDYHKNIYRERVTSSRPGQILVGGNLSLDGNELNNDKSEILVGGAISYLGQADKINNSKVLGHETTQTIGRQWNSVSKEGWYKRRKRQRRTEVDYRNYNQTQSATYNLNVARVEEHVSNLPTQLGNPADVTGLVAPSIHGAQRNQQSTVVLPNSSLYTTQPNHPDYLVETDPAFTNYRQWIGSDYLLNALGARNLHKRLGDGYYEQKLVNEQIARLTGYRRLDGYNNDEDQLKALMDAGITFARSQQLVPGVALSAAQVAQLTSDMVWLENQTVTLKDGSQQTVLVPKVYVVARKGDLNSTGSLISANVMQLNADEIRNGGTIAGRKVVDLRAQNIEHSGQIRGEKVWLEAKNQINLQGGDISADKLLSLSADQINASSTTATSGDKQNGNTVVDKVARLSVGADGSEGGILSIQSKHDTQLNGAVVRNTSQGGKTQIISENGNVDLGTVATERHESYGSLSDKKHRHVHQTAEVGTDIQSQGDLLVKAGNDIKIRQGNLDSEKGLTALQAGHNIQISEGRSTLDFDESVYTQSKGVLSKRSSLDTYQRQHDEAQGSSVTGKLVYMDAGHDLNVVGSDIVSEQKAQLHAGHNAQLTTAQSYYNDRESHQTKKSGLMGTGGIGFTIGSKQDQFTQTSQVVQQVGSTAGSLNGDALITAGNQYSQIGSTVSTPKGRITVDAAKINIADAKNIQIGESEYTHQQKGLTIALKTPITNLAQQAIDTAKNAKQVGQSKNARVNAMAAANTAMQAFQTGKAVRKIQNGETNLKEVGISLTYGEQKNRQTSSSYHTESQASQILSGAGPAVLSATGQGKDSQINITGSDVIGKGSTALYADGAINAQAAQNTHSEHSRNTSKGWNAGVSVNFNGGSPSFGFTAGGNKGKGHANGEQTTYRHSHVGSADSPTIIMSGGDTNIKGAQVTGKGITVRATNLNIESLQDTADYHSRQQNIKGQVTVGYGASASGDYSQSKINAEHRSVSEQSGLFAGEDGFDVQVGGHTQLTGGIITASQSAEEQGKNRFITGTLTTSDIKNHSRYEGESFGIGASASISGKTLGQGEQNHPQESHLKTVADKNGTSSSIGYGNDSDSQSSITKSGINTQNIRITDEDKQIQLTGKTAQETKADIYTNTTSETAQQHSGSLKNVFDKEAVQSELDLQVQVTKEFGTVAPNLVANASEKLGNVSEYETVALIKADAERTLAQTSDENERIKLVQTIQQADEYLTANKTAYETWKEGGIGRALLQSGVGGLMTGNASGTLAGGTTSLVAPYLNTVEEKLGTVGGGVLNTVGGAAIGYAVGGNVGTATVGANVDWHNRQLHPSEYKLAEQYADIVASRLKISREEALGRIIRHMQRTVDYATAKADNFHTDDAIISILGANNLPKQDQYYTNPNYNKQYIQNYVRDFNLANKYNYFGKTPTQSRDYKVGVVVDIGKAALNSGINAVESTVNLATGEIDPNSWAYVHMGRIGYTHPEYGNALENTMTLGVAAVTAGRAGTQVRVRNIQQTKLVEELTANGIKFNPNNVVAITKTTDGKIVWLETGNSRAGLNHIIERHRQEFLKKGISESEIPNYLMTAVKNGQIVGMQRTRPIYEFTYNGTKHRVAIDIGNNGFIVGANPKGVVK
ncbi:hemagglutinin repeat-containing protein [Kingella negevensis]|nr:hemagglutinin repeat-containing protein [Kingella negevensis]MDK4709059.1 hemagglutinin repeat-containing protein [Kingella negevensis]